METEINETVTVTLFHGRKTTLNIYGKDSVSLIQKNGHERHVIFLTMKQVEDLYGFAKNK